MQCVQYYMSFESFTENCKIPQVSVLKLFDIVTLGRYQL